MYRCPCEFVKKHRCSMQFGIERFRENLIPRSRSNVFSVNESTWVFSTAMSPGYISTTHAAGIRIPTQTHNSTLFIPNVFCRTTMIKQKVVSVDVHAIG